MKWSWSWPQTSDPRFPGILPATAAIRPTEFLANIVLANGVTVAQLVTPQIEEHYDDDSEILWGTVGISSTRLGSNSQPASRLRTEECDYGVHWRLGVSVAR